MGFRQQVFKTAFKVLRSSGLGRALAPVTQGCGAVFMMHQVRAARMAEFQPNLHLEITPEFMRQAVERIRESGYEIIALDEAVDLLKSGYGRKRYAVLTFDDGYRDNLEIAYPVLKELDAPFTVFVASGLVDRTTELWWVALEQMIAANDEILLTGDNIGEGIACGTVEEKMLCYERLCGLLTREVSEQDQRMIIRGLADRYGFDLHALSDGLMMTWDEVRALASDSLVTIGAHTHHHFALARLNDADALRDIESGIERLETELGRRPKHFAYPYGNPAVVSERDARLLMSLGFRSSVTTFPGVLKSVHAKNTMMLPRVSLNGRFQDPYVVDQYLTGAPFALYKAARWAKGGFGLRSEASRIFPSTR